MNLMIRRCAAALVVPLLIATACTSESNSETPHDGSAAPTTSTALPPTEESISFEFAGNELYGVLTRPAGEGPHPAIILLSGSGDSEGVRAGANARMFVSHSRRLAEHGFAVLRYDPPGVGRSTGQITFPSLEQRVEETHAAIAHLQSLERIDSERIGLQGWSQGPWIMAMTAVQYPEQVAFLVSVVGSGQSVAEQQVYGIATQSEAAGLSSADVSKAVLVGRLLIDWQLPQPMFEEANRRTMDALGGGPWDDLAGSLYGPEEVDPQAQIEMVVEMLETVRSEPWAEAIYPDLYLTRLRSIPTSVTDEELASIREVMATNLSIDPKDSLTEVRVPMIAFFGEDDVNIDTELSAERFDSYLTQAGNDDYRIVVLPDVGHNIDLSTPGYWDALAEWLTTRFG